MIEAQPSLDYLKEPSTGGSPVKDQKKIQSCNDFEIEDFMPDGFEQFENASSLEMLCESEQNLRASASPFYPEKESGKLDNSFRIKHDLAQLREDGRLLQAIILIVDRLPSDEQAELAKHISESSNFEQCQDVEQY